MEKYIVQLLCGSDSGTAFFVAPNMLLAARHTIAFRTGDDNIYILDQVEGRLPLEIIKEWEEYDVVLLKVHGRQAQAYLHLLSQRIRIGESIVTYGFPDQSKNSGLRVDGHVVQLIKNKLADVKICCPDIDASFNYEGMSGAPIMLNEEVCGIVIEQSASDLQLVSIRKIVEALRAEDFTVNEPVQLTSIPEGLREAVESSNPNYGVFDLIDENLNNGGKWHLICGSPGCGKTTLAASYIPADENIVILGRFFLKVPSDNISAAERCSVRFFLDWMESVYMGFTTTDMELLSQEEKIKRLPSWIHVISKILSQDGKSGLIIIDGLDELVSNGVSHTEDILNIINFVFPENIQLLLSCTSKIILPESIITTLDKENCIEVTPLDMTSCEAYILNNSGEWDKPYTFIQAIATKTGGHPLYMNYLCRYIETEFDSTTKEDTLNEWIESLPSIGSNIEAYYNAIWKKVSIDSDSVEILAILSQVRGSISEEGIIGIIEPGRQFSFYSKIDHLRFLLKTQENGVYEIYHNSFNLFLSAKLKYVLKSVNDQIVTYCNANSDISYAVENTLHHVLNGTHVEKGMIMCNQQWADKCAQLDLSPDLILNDIKECLAAAVDECKPMEVVRLMLLAQRIESRYDVMFAENADLMADVKLAMGNPNALLRYLIRENTLLVSEMSGVRYLQQLYDCGYIEQAHILYEAVEGKCRQRLFGKKGESMSIEPFIAKGAAQVELMKESEIGEQRLIQTYKFYHKFKSSYGDDKENDNFKSMDYVQSVVLSYQLASRIREDYVPNFDFYFKKQECEWNKKIAVMAFRALYLFQQMNTAVAYKPKNEAFYCALTQLETKLERYKDLYLKDELNWILNVLIENSKRSDLTKELIAQFIPKDEQLTIRKVNGVDVDFGHIVSVYEQMWYIGYADDNDHYPTLNKKYYDNVKVWESYIASLIKRTAYIQGHLCRKNADGIFLDGYYIYLKQIIDNICFTFELRSSWENSYQIPESVFPYLYAKIATLYRDFYPLKISDLITHLIERSKDQLSLYREGYVEAMFNVMERFTEMKYFPEETKTIADILHEYILYALLNRNERTTALLKLVSVYAHIGQESLSKTVYQEMLDTSMGPGWYKEAQMGMLNKLADYGLRLTAEQAARFASIFEEASGEMTFQRYVQQEQNHFVGNLVKTSSLSDAIGYYTFKTLPSYDVVKHNAEDWTVMPTAGNGYNLGANHLIEASALHYLLEQTNNASPYVQYALSELFWDNDDKFRYGSLYARLHANIIKRLAKNEVVTHLLPRMANYFVNKYTGKYDNEYFTCLEDGSVEADILDAFQKELATCGYNWKRIKEVKEKHPHEETISEKLHSLPSVREVLQYNKRAIVNPLSEYWYALDEIFDSIVEKMEGDTNVFSDILLNHFDLIVKPKKSIQNRFSFMTGYSSNEHFDKLLINLLIWYLNHPVIEVVLRSENALLWLSTYTSKTMECLIEQIMKLGNKGEATYASKVLLEIAKTNPQIVVDELAKKGIVDALTSIKSFSISRNLYYIGEQLSMVGYTALKNALIQIIPDSCPDRGDVFFDNMDMMFIEHKIDKLNYQHVLGGAFAKQYLAEIQVLKKQGVIKDLIRADIYVRRSFFLDHVESRFYNQTMMNIIDRCLYGTVDKKRLNYVYHTINS